MNNSTHVWLDYVAFPVTTAVYFERAFRQRCRTTTIGPSMPDHLIKKGLLQNMKLPLKPQDIPTDPAQDMKELLRGTAPEDSPDLYIWVESLYGHYPQNLDAICCPKACYLIDSHLNLSFHLEWAKNFDFVFIAQLEYLDQFRATGLNAFWLPLGCDLEVHRKLAEEKTFEISFVGTVLIGSRRHQLLHSVAEAAPVHYERCFWDDMANAFSQSKIVFNNGIKNDLNMRVFEAMSIGSLLLTDQARNSGQAELFRDGEDYAVYQDSNIVDVATFYLQNDALREQIAARGQRLVHNAHTYGHRVDDLLAVALGGKPETLSAEEMRERSVAAVPAIDAAIHDYSCISSASRSFIIPVLDMSPASEFNIVTLLRDLEYVEGDVIIIFNSQEVAEDLKGHPRITRYAVMKQNVGVARAWNLGLEMAATPTVFILNADLHVEASAIDALEKALWDLPDAACVGPQGSFVNYALTKDYMYFDKGTFQEPLEVDAVSGFFFAVKLEHFNDKTIRFENAFTPCYFEEWDLGLQIRVAGLKNYIVPTSAYDHHWSGSIRALREIRYYDESETAGEILLRNRRFFLNKWRGVASRDGRPGLLLSGYSSFALRQVNALMQVGCFEDAQKWLSPCPYDAEISALRRFLDFQVRKLEQLSRQPEGEQ